MNAFILVFYTYLLFSASQRGVFGWLGKIFGLEEDKSIVMHNGLASVTIYEYLDPDVNPCDNFYKFACGNWIKTMKTLKKDDKSIGIRSEQINFLRFVDDAHMGRYNDESKMVHTIYQLRKKCEQLPKDKIKDCQSEIYNFGKYALSSVFVKLNQKKSEENGDYAYLADMINRIKEEFRLLIDKKRDMFDEETRNNFKSKLHKMKFLKENSELYYVSDVYLMEQCYDMLGIKNYDVEIEDLIKNIKQIKALSSNHMNDSKTCRAKIFQPENYMDLLVFRNGMYSPDGNYFSVNSDAVNQPSFSTTFPHSLNYGGIGTLIGHEIIRAFDSDNYRRILEGENENEFNVTTLSIKNFKEESDCFVEQYSVQKENITNKNINGSLTLARNIADNGGQKIAFRAYMNFFRSNGDKDSSVPAYEKFNKEQLFFIGAARRHCSYETEDILEKQIETNEYTPSEIRVNTAFSNSVYFYRAFSCPETTKMNDQLKCDLW
uniref:Phosphate-regulating neutral endopeptidase (inferred by orthology to a human protein) n=1 Tax=Strongyloides venezuelensis TaxID=75913 RepID=A0A0K0G371_STRVS